MDGVTEKMKNKYFSATFEGFMSGYCTVTIEY